MSAPIINASPCSSAKSALSRPGFSTNPYVLVFGLRYSNSPVLGPILTSISEPCNSDKTFLIPSCFSASL